MVNESQGSLLSSFSMDSALFIGIWISFVIDSHNIFLCKKLIKAVKNGEDTLLVVPFAGSGSECVAAKKENINFIGYEINEEYVKLCNERVNAATIES